MRRSPVQIRLSAPYGLLAQLAERLTVNQNVAGSSPARGASKPGCVSAFLLSTLCVAVDVERRSSCCEGFERVFRDCMCVTSSLILTIRLLTALHPTISYSNAFCLTDSYTCYASFMHKMASHVAYRLRVSTSRMKTKNLTTQLPNCSGTMS